MMDRSVKIRLRFRPEETKEPFVYLLATRFGLVFSILQADITPDRGGRMVLELTGAQSALEEALEYAAAQGVNVQVLSRVIRWDDQVCVHCGSCTAVCVHRALTLDGETAMLSFDNARCVVCEMCTKACPTGALKVELSE